MFALLKEEILKLDPTASIIHFVPKLKGPGPTQSQHPAPLIVRGYAVDDEVVGEREAIAQREAAFYIAEHGLGRSCALRMAEENGLGTIIYDMNAIEN